MDRCNIDDAGTDFGDALRRLIGVDPKEIEAEIAKTKRKGEEIERDVKRTEESIDAGGATVKAQIPFMTLEAHAQCGNSRGSVGNALIAKGRGRPHDPKGDPAGPLTTPASADDL